MFSQWRQQSRAGSGQLVYSVCESLQPRKGDIPWLSDSRHSKEAVKRRSVEKEPNFARDNLADSVHKVRTNWTNLQRSTRTTDDTTEYWLFSPIFDSDQILSVHVHIGYQMQGCSHETSGTIDRGSKKVAKCREEFDVMIRQFDRWENLSLLEVRIHS